MDRSNENKVDKDMEVLKAMLDRTKANTIVPAQHENNRGELSAKRKESKHAEIATNTLVDEMSRYIYDMIESPFLSTELARICVGLSPHTCRILFMRAKARRRRMQCAKN